MSATTVISESEIFASVLEDAAPMALSADVARFLLALRLSEAHLRRMHELAQKAGNGELTGDDELALGNFRDVGNCLALLHSKARKVLKEAAQAN